MIGDSYATLPQFKNYMKIDASKTGYDAAMQDALDSASEEIELFCERQFNKETSATARFFTTISCSSIEIDDLWDPVTVVVKSGTADNLGDPWSSTYYELLPRNGVVNGVPGWPYSRIRALNRPLNIPSWGVVQVTAKWGWAAVPAPIKQACLIIASQNFKLAEAPLGVAGFNNFGSVRVREIPQAYSKLCRYAKSPVMVG